MNAHDPRILFLMIALGNIVTAAFTMSVVIRRPILRHKVIAAVAIWAVTASIQQVLTKQFNLVSLLLNAVLVLSITFQAVLNNRRPRSRSR